MSAHRTTAKPIQYMADTLCRSVGAVQALEIRKKVDDGVAADEIVQLIKQPWPDKAFLVVTTESIVKIVDNYEVRSSPVKAAQQCNAKRLSTKNVDLLLVYDMLEQMTENLPDCKCFAVVISCGMNHIRKALKVIFAKNGISCAVCDTGRIATATALKLSKYVTILTDYSINQLLWLSQLIGSQERQIIHKIGPQFLH